MALTSSTMLPLGTVAPTFQLYDVITEKELLLDSLKSDTATVIMFICNHCPYVKHIQEELVSMAEDFIPEGISFIAISSNDVDYFPEDSPDRMRDEARKWGYPFPYLYDETQMVARAYDAACTPDFYVFDSEMKLIYRGQLDDSRPGNGKPLTGADLRGALSDYLNGIMVSENQIPSQGCNIKWKE